MKMLMMLAAGVLGASAVVTVEAQGVRMGAAVDSSAYLKAEGMVNNGNSAEGRAMVDSLLALTKPGSAQYVEGLYWRAKLSSSADSAQKDYARIVVEYSESSRVPDALLNLGQLEFVRGQRDKAQAHFDRLRRDYPGHVLQATGSYWSARTLLEANSLQKGCLMNAEALTQVRPGNIELQNRIKFQNQRCQGVDLAFKDSALNAGVSGDATADNASSVTPKEKTPAIPTSAAKGKTVPVKGSTAVASKTKTADSTKTATVKTETAVTTSSTTTTAGAATSGERYAVQVAAYKTKEQAGTLVESLKKKGYTARVDGSQAPFRVKIGRFVSRAGAEALLTELKAKSIEGFITKG